MLHWVKVGDIRQMNIYMALGRVFERMKKSRELGAPLLYLIKHETWGRTMCAMSIRITLLLSFDSLSFLSLQLGPTEQSPPPFFPATTSPFLIRFLNRKTKLKMENGSIGNEILQTIYR
jgi:hypothetical protein